MYDRNASRHDHWSWSYPVGNYRTIASEHADERKEARDILLFILGLTNPPNELVWSSQPKKDARMHTVSLFEAKTHLSRIVESLVSGREDRVVISRRGKPVALVTPLHSKDVSKRIGIARGRFTVSDDIDGSNSKITALFRGTKEAS